MLARVYVCSCVLARTFVCAYIRGSANANPTHGYIMLEWTSTSLGYVQACSTV
jgi:hypothetical protein